MSFTSEELTAAILELAQKTRLEKEEHTLELAVESKLLSVHGVAHRVLEYLRLHHMAADAVTVNVTFGSDTFLDYHQSEHTPVTIVIRPNGTA